MAPVAADPEATPTPDRAWIRYKERWFPGVLETWNTRDGVMRFWISYAVPVNGWPGGWYTDFLADDGDDPNGEGLTWSSRVAAAAAPAPLVDDETHADG